MQCYFKMIVLLCIKVGINSKSHYPFKQLMH
jgi:hypothetical protein